MSNTAIFFGSTTGNTESVAKQIAELLDAATFNVADEPTDELENHSLLIFGTSTWGIGDLQDDWEGFVAELEGANLEGKTIAIFGLGDADSYADSFVDGMKIIYDAVEGKGCKIIGFVDTDGYEYDSSAAEVNGKFIGLPLDEDNESDKTEERIKNWVEQIQKEIN